MQVDSFPQCFVCGLENPAGLALEFAVEPEGKARTVWTAEEKYAGYPRILHGGILSTLLDETMAKAIQGLGITGLTAKLEVSFRRPAFIGDRLAITAWVESRQGRKMITRGEVRNDKGQVLAEARGLFILRQE